MKFNTSEEAEHLATPKNLMGLLIKEHLKVIQNETGVECKEIAITLFDSFDDRDGLEKQLKEAGDLVKVEVSFFETEIQKWSDEEMKGLCDEIKGKFYVGA